MEPKMNYLSRDAPDLHHYQGLDSLSSTHLVSFQTRSIPTTNKQIPTDITWVFTIRMSGLKYYSYPGVGEWARDKYSYSQAVRIGDRIECSGQGRWKAADRWDLGQC